MAAFAAPLQTAVPCDRFRNLERFAVLGGGPRRENPACRSKIRAEASACAHASPPRRRSALRFSSSHRRSTGDVSRASTMAGMMVLGCGRCLQFSKGSSSFLQNSCRYIRHQRPRPGRRGCCAHMGVYAATYRRIPATCRIGVPPRQLKAPMYVATGHSQDSTYGEVDESCKATRPTCPIRAHTQAPRRQSRRRSTACRRRPPREGRLRRT